jgi:nicotinate-nucleotide adenylyltransferase
VTHLSPLLLVYGGTFDPVHRGHVAVATAAADASGAEKVLLIPCGDPPHRAAPTATGALRAELLGLAFGFDARFVVDERELHRAGPSFMADTLIELRHEVGPDAPMALLLGFDAADGLPSWERWRELPALAHLILVPRPGQSAKPDLEVREAWLPVAHPAELRSAPAGYMFCLPAAVSEASSTASRSALARGAVEIAELPPRVVQRLRRNSPYAEAVKRHEN